MNQHPLPPGPPPAGPVPTSQLATAGFIVALLGFLMGIIPFAGLLGTVGGILALIDLNQRDPVGRPRPRNLAVAGVVLGALATGGVAIWIFIFVSVANSSSRASCPHLYAFDGERYRLDADLVSGALYAGAERDDRDRLESLRAVGGEYRLRIVDELQETDHVDSLSLEYVDHPRGVEVLPTPTGELVALRDAAAPLRAVDATGRDVLPLLASLDGRMVSGDEGGAPRQAWTLDFARPRTSRAALIVRGHNTPFAEEALVAYLATMGQGLRPLLEWRYAPGCDCTRRDLDAEAARLGLPLAIQLSAGGAWAPAPSLEPVGPAILRSQALLVDLPPGGDRISVRLEATSLFWEIDQVELAPVSEPPLEPTVIRPRSAIRSSGEDVTSLIAEGDGRHVVLRPGEHVDVRFDAPPPAPGLERTVTAAMRGYYAMDIGGRPGINPALVIAHRLGLVSLPSFATRLPRLRAAP